MKRNILKIGLVAIMATFALISCKKDEAPKSETNKVETTTKGDVYSVDVATSKVEWKGYKILKSENTSHFGGMKFQSGEITLKDGKLESGKFVVDTKSLASEDLKDDPKQAAALDGHLKASDFLDVEKFPTAAYEITKISELKEGDFNTLLEGNLTMKGITKPVSFKANVSVKEGEVTIATESKDINRAEFGITFKAPVENGVLKDEVSLQIAVKAMPKK